MKKKLVYLNDTTVMKIMVVFLAIAFGAIFFGFEALYTIILPPYLNILFWVSLALSIAVFLPLSIFKKTRLIGAGGLRVNAYFLGLICLLGCVGIVWHYWGQWLVIIGFTIMVFPLYAMGLIAPIISGDSSSALTVALCIVSVLIIGFLSVYFEEKYGKEHPKAQSKEAETTRSILERASEFATTETTKNLKIGTRRKAQKKDS